MIYLRARYYDSGAGAFTSADTHWNVGNMIYGDDTENTVPEVAAILQSGNLYVYCMGNPVNFWDSNGLDAIIITDEDAVGNWGGHTSVLVQDAGGVWYYFYWGNNERFLTEVTNPAAMSSLDNFNQWLHEYNQELGHATYNDNYDYATYIRGDFSDSVRFYVDVCNNPNVHYNLAFYNCLQASMDGINRGVLYDGTKVSDYLHGWAFGAQPKTARAKINSAFYNGEFTYEKYWKTINDQLWVADVNNKPSRYRLRKLYY